MERRAQLATALVIAVVLIAVPLAAHVLNEPFYLNFCRRVVIMAIAVVSLDLILGYGGMVSLGHASFLGIGGYSVAILSSYGIDNGYIQLALAIGLSLVFAYASGMLALRTSSFAFIMLTLAFSQILYFLAIAVKAYGGEDGLPLIARSNFGAWLDLRNDTKFYFLCIAVLGAVLLLCDSMVRARFGAVLQGLRSNERRMTALGYPKLPYQLTAFMTSGAICGLAGVLLANHTEYVSPDYLHWSRSADLLIMLILGGRRSLVGAVIGTATYLGLDLGLSAWTAHWQLIFAPILLLIVLIGDRGIFGVVASALARRGGTTVPFRHPG